MKEDMSFIRYAGKACGIHLIPFIAPTVDRKTMLHIHQPPKPEALVSYLHKVYIKWDTSVSGFMML
jgi:hypothetical protein